MGRQHPDTSAHLAAVAGLVEAALDGHAEASVTVDGETATVSLSDERFAATALHPLLTAGYTADYADRAGRRLRVRWEAARHDARAAARRRALEGTPSAERLAFAWCLERWGRADYPGGSDHYAEMWRHLLECDQVDGAMDLGVAHSAACDTCFHEYPAVLWWVRCGCGLVRLGSERDPHDLASPTGEPWSMPAILSEMDALAARYRDSDASYPMWMPGISRRPRTAAGAVSDQ